MPLTTERSKSILETERAGLLRKGERVRNVTQLCKLLALHSAAGAGCVPSQLAADFNNDGTVDAEDSIHFFDEFLNGGGE